LGAIVDDFPLPHSNVTNSRPFHTPAPLKLWTLASSLACSRVPTEISVKAAGVLAFVRIIAATWTRNKSAKVVLGSFAVLQC
jgi:hypothetical protein